MKQTEKKEVVNFIQTTLADGHPKTGTQLMELFAEHAGLQEYNRKNLKQVFHRVSLSLADEGKIVVTRQLGTAPLLFSIPTENSQQDQHQQSVPENPPLTPEPNAIITQKLEQLIDQEAMLAGRENGLQILLELSPQKESYIREELRKLRYERLVLQSCRQVLSEFGFSN
ncbi:MAG: hypothetical protein KKE30_03945 [Gammaproteobacteria bacterium]|nr:hypothetical protein [Gammaproteobacteria bacterium]